MAGVSAIGVHLPCTTVYSTGRGPRRVAGGDEDALTLAVEATGRCLEQVEPLTFGGLFFASTTPPFRETPLSSIIATACDLPRDIVTADFGGSIRSGLSALLAAVRAVDGGVRRILVVAADHGSRDHSDGAVAVVVDAKARVAEMLASAAVAEDFSFQSPVPGEEPERPLRDLAEVVERVINEFGVGPEDLAGLAASGAPLGVLLRLADLAAVGDRLVREHLERFGALATAEPLLRLAVALERAKPGDRIVLAAGGHGAEAALFQAGEVAGEGACRPIVDSFADGDVEGSKTGPRVGPSIWEPDAVEERARVRGEPVAVVARNTRLYGSRCAACGGVQFPHAVDCPSCGAHEGLEPAKIAKRGIVAALHGASGHARVALDGGGHIEMAVTDALPDALVAGTPVLLTLRRGPLSGSARYVWKARPAKLR